MAHLEFIYSPIYDEMLGKLSGQSYSSRQEKAGYKFQKQITTRWQKYDAKLFNYYKKIGLAAPNHWLIYIAHKRFELDPFSDPTTILISKDQDDVIATVVHELGHLLLKQPQNERKLVPIWRYIDKTFKKEHWRVKVHLPVSLLARASMRELMGREKAEKILLPERRFYGLKKAWAIIDKQGDLDWDRPLKAMRQLQPIKK